MSLYLAYSGEWTDLNMEAQEFGPWIQNSGFGHGPCKLLGGGVDTSVREIPPLLKEEACGATYRSQEC
jgi:hypothetical protein